MPPYDLNQWPDGTAVASLSHKRKRKEQPAAQAAAASTAASSSHVERPRPVVSAALASLRARVLARLGADQAV